MHIRKLLAHVAFTLRMAGGGGGGGGYGVTQAANGAWSSLIYIWNIASFSFVLHSNNSKEQVPAAWVWYCFDTTPVNRVYSERIEGGPPSARLWRAI